MPQKHLLKKFIEAAHIRDADTVMKIIDDGIDLNATLDGVPLLFLAKEDSGLFNHMLRKGADTETIFSPYSQERALHYFARRRSSESWLTSLITHGVDLEAKDVDGHSALAIAVITGLESIYTLLIDAGADINAQDNGGWTVLNLVLGRDQKACALLLEKGALTKDEIERR